MVSCSPAVLFCLLAAFTYAGGAVALESSSALPALIRPNSFQQVGDIGGRMGAMPTFDLRLAVQGERGARAARIEEITGTIRGLFLIPQLNGLLSPLPICQASLREELMLRVQAQVSGALARDVGVPAQQAAYVEGLRSIMRDLAGIVFRQAGINDSRHINAWADHILRPFQECLARGGSSNIGGVVPCAAQQGIDYRTLLANVGLGITHETWRQLNPTAAEAQLREYRECVAANRPGGSLGCLSDQIVQAIPYRIQEAVPVDTSIRDAQARARDRQQRQAAVFAQLSRQGDFSRRPRERSEFHSCVGRDAERFGNLVGGCSNRLLGAVAEAVSSQALSRPLEGNISGEQLQSLINQFTGRDGSFPACLRPAPEDRCSLASFAENRTDRCQRQLLADVGGPAGESLFSYQYNRYMALPENQTSRGQSDEVRNLVLGRVNASHETCMRQVQSQDTSSGAMGALNECFAGSVIRLISEIGSVTFDDTMASLLGPRPEGDQSLSRLRTHFQDRLENCLEGRITPATLAGSADAAEACAQDAKDFMTPLVAENILDYNLAKAFPDNPDDADITALMHTRREAVRSRLMPWLQTCLAIPGNSSDQCASDFEPLAHLLIARSAADGQMQDLRIGRASLTAQERASLNVHDRAYLGCLYPEGSRFPEQFQDVATEITGAPLNPPPLPLQGSPEVDLGACDRAYALAMGRDLGPIAINRILAPPMVTPAERTAAQERVGALVGAYHACLTRAGDFAETDAVMGGIAACARTLALDGGSLGSELIRERMVGSAVDASPDAVTNQDAERARDLMSVLLPCIGTGINPGAGGEEPPANFSILSLAGEVAGDYIHYDPIAARARLESVGADYLHTLGDRAAPATCNLARLRELVPGFAIVCAAQPRLLPAAALPDLNPQGTAACFATRSLVTGQGMAEQLLRGVVRGQALRAGGGMPQSDCPALQMPSGGGDEALSQVLGNVVRHENMERVLRADENLAQTLDRDIVQPIMCMRRPVSEVRPALNAVIGRTVGLLVEDEGLPATPDRPAEAGFGEQIINHLIAQAVDGKINELNPVFRGLARTLLGRRLDWQGGGCSQTGPGKAATRRLATELVRPLILQQAGHPDGASLQCTDIERSMREAECMVMRAIRCCDMEKRRPGSCSGRDSLAGERRRLRLPALPEGEYCRLR